MGTELKSIERVLWYLTVRDAGSVERFHNVRITKSQDNAQHSHAAALIAHSIATYYNETIAWANHKNEIGVPHVDPEKCAMYMILHDIGEIYTGDLPGPFKGKHPELGKNFKMEERRWLSRSVPPELQSLACKLNLTKTETAIVDFVDEYECYLKVLDEFKMGNRHVAIDIVAIHASLKHKIRNAIVGDNGVINNVLDTTLYDTNQLHKSEVNEAESYATNDRTKPWR